MGYWLSLKSTRASVDELVLINDWSATGYIRESGGDWGFVDNQGIFSGSIDTEGSSKVGERVENRTLTLPILIDGTTATIVQTRWDALADMAGELREHKGTVRFRPSTATYGVDFEIEHARLENDYWPKLAELGVARRVNLVLTVRPYALMDPMDVEDDFSTDTLGTGGRYNNGGADWTRDAGAAGDLVITGGVLDAAANFSTEQRLYHTGAPHTYGDVQVTARYVPGATISSFKGGVIVKRVDASNYVEVYVDDNGTNSRLRIDKVIAGVRTNMATTNLASRIADNAPFWVVGRIEHNQVFAEHWDNSAYPYIGGTPTTSTSDVFDTTEAALFGMSQNGRTGLVFIPQHSSAHCGWWEAKAYVYRHGNFGQRLDLQGDIPGNTDALARISWARASGASSTYMLMAWDANLPRYDISGLLGDGVSNLFSVSAVAGVISAATSINNVTTTWHYGNGSQQIVCPATTDTGATKKIYSRFKKGVPYTFSCYLRSGTGTTLARVKLGVSGDIATGTSVALSTTWTQYSVTWTPSSDQEFAYAAIGIAAATATTFQADSYVVYEGGSVDAIKQEDSRNDQYPPWLRPFGIYHVLNGNTNLASTSSATALGGQYFSFATASSIDAGEVSFEGVQEDDLMGVYARLYIPSGVTGFSLTAQLGTSSAAPSTYTVEYGSTGKTVPAPSSGNVHRTVYLGAIPLGSRIKSPPSALRITATYGGTAPGIDSVVLVPMSRSCGSQTGVAGSAVPVFGGAGEYAVASNLQGLFRSTPRKFFPGNGLLGSQIKIPTGSASILIYPTDYATDRTDANSSTQALDYAGATHISIQPRVLMTV